MYSRPQRWERAEILPNEHIGIVFQNGPTIVYLWAWECSQPHCNEKRNIRWTESGAWCERHYKELPSCPVCGEPAIIDPVWFPGNIYCRNHLWHEDRLIAEWRMERKEIQCCTVLLKNPRKVG